MKKKAYRPIRRKLSEDEARNLLAQAYIQRQNCMEELWFIEHKGVSPLISALCHQTPQQMSEQAQAQIEWLDKRIEDLHPFLSRKITIDELLGYTMIV